MPPRYTSTKMGRPGEPMILKIKKIIDLLVGLTCSSTIHTILYTLVNQESTTSKRVVVSITHTLSKAMYEADFERNQMINKKCS